MLTNEQKKELRSLSHNEATLVYIGKHGLTETVYETFDIALNAHNLVKVGIQQASETKISEVIEAFEDRFACDLVMKVGRVAVFYRYNPKGRVKV